MLTIRTLTAFVLVLGLGAFSFAEDKGARQPGRRKYSATFQTTSHNSISEAGSLFGGTAGFAKPTGRTTTLSPKEPLSPRANGWKLLFFSENGVKAPARPR